MKVLQISQCPLCQWRHSDEIKLGEAALRRCRRCRLVYASALADPSQVYVDGYFRGGQRFGVDIFAPGYQAYLAAVNRRRLAMLERAVPRNGGRALLDVGCGHGDLLKVARERGWRTTGVELVEEAAHYARSARGLDVVNSALEDSGLPESAFDVVTMMHVVEHVADATEFVRAAARRARRGGTIVVEVPNFASWLRWKTSSAWMHLRPLEHVSHFTPRTLAKLLRRAGLKNVTIATPSYLVTPMSLDSALAVMALPALRSAASHLSYTQIVEGVEQESPGRELWAILRTADFLLSLPRCGMVVFATATRA